MEQVDEPSSARELGSPRPLWRQALVASGVLALVLAPWPGWKAAYARLFRLGIEGAFALVGLEDVAAEANTGRRAARLDTRLVVPEGDGRWSYTLDSRLTGLLPLAVFLALFAAGARRRATTTWRLVAGLALVHAYVAARVLLAYLYGLTRHVRDPCRGEHAELLRAPGWQRTIEVLAGLDAAPAVYVLVPVLIWAASTSRRGSVAARGAPADAPVSP